VCVCELLILTVSLYYAAQQRLTALEKGELDTEAFLEFERLDRLARQQQEMEELEKRVLLGQISREDAIAARHAVSVGLLPYVLVLLVVCDLIVITSFRDSWLFFA